MQLVINNMLFGTRWVEDLSKSEIKIGRILGDETAEDKPDVVLPSRMASRGTHAILRQVNDAWAIEHHGSTATWLNELQLKSGKCYPLSVDDVMRIGEFVLSIVEKSVEDEKRPAVSAFSELIELEQIIHNKLLTQLDLRRQEGLTNLEEPGTREKIEQHLIALIDDELNDLTDELLDELMYTAVYRRFNWKITSSGSRKLLKGHHSGSSQDSPFESDIDTFLSKMADKIGICFEPKAMEEDSKRLDTNFQTVFEINRIELTPGLRHHLIHSMMSQDILDLIFGLGPLQDLMEMDSISEIMVVSRDQIFVEKFGVVEDTRRRFFSDELLMSIIERIVAPVGRRIDRSTPLVDARLPNGSRVNAIIPPLSIKGPCITIRKFSKTPLEISDLVGFGTLSNSMVKFLQACVRGRKNIIVSGGTGSGKTTLLNCLSRFISPKERIVTIEDTAELQLKQSHVVTLESRPPNMEGKGEISIRDLVKNALRMRPDRIVVGECRGAEALDMLQAMNTGHDGSMTTGHANSPIDIMLRLETMALMATTIPIAAIREQIVAALDLVVQLSRLSDGTRRVTHVSEVIGIDENLGYIIIEDIFRYRPLVDKESRDVRYIHSGYIPTFTDELLKKGLMTLDTFF